jgi:quinol monooxygenase YgiN
MPSTPPAGQGGPEAITLVVTMSIKPEFEDDFLEMAAGFADLVYANEPGTLFYVLTRHPSREHTYVWVERYRDEEAMKLHRETSYMAEVRPKLEQYLAAPPEGMRLTQVVPDQAPGQGH